MKIIYLTNVRIPTEKAHGLQIMKMCEAFAETSDVELVVPRRLNPLKIDPFVYYGVKRNFKITRLPCLDLISLKYGRIGYWVETLTFMMSARIYLWFKKFDILYSREFAISKFFSSFVLEIHDLPKVPTAHHKYSWKKASKLVVLTRFLKEDLVAQGIEGAKILVAPDGVDLDEFTGVVAKQISKQKVVMYTGSFFLYGWKGVDTLIEAAKQFPSGVEMVLIGGTNEEVSALQTTTAGNHAGSIRLIGRIPHPEIPKYLASADILVLPNKKGDANSERYTSPLKLFEYMASGKPIIASDLPSMREILNDNNCTFFSPGDPTSLARAIQVVLNDPVVAQKKAAQALADAQHYSWKKRAQTIVQFVRNV